MERIYIAQLGLEELILVYEWDKCERDSLNKIFH